MDELTLSPSDLGASLRSTINTTDDGAARLVAFSGFFSSWVNTSDRTSGTPVSIGTRCIRPESLFFFFLCYMHVVPIHGIMCLDGYRAAIKDRQVSGEVMTFYHLFVSFPLNGCNRSFGSTP
mmetsp:Transcript_59905/g.81947  ORF Transcript_59905/g.81947 Transcript_59905/m.81947 type:complete len:122 (-) Transcript_59905:382-747(-)